MWDSYPRAGNRVHVYVTLYELHEHPCWRPLTEGVLALLTIKAGAATEVLQLARIHQIMQRLPERELLPVHHVSGRRPISLPLPACSGHCWWVSVCIK